MGQRLIVIRNPFGLDQTGTMGVVSALNREVRSVGGGGGSGGRRRGCGPPAVVDDSVIRGCIQTDAAINPRNSGGPLLRKFPAYLAPSVDQKGQFSSYIVWPTHLHNRVWLIARNTGLIACRFQGLTSGFFFRKIVGVKPPLLSLTIFILCTLSTLAGWLILNG